MKRMAMTVLTAALMAAGFSDAIEARPRDGDFHNNGGFSGGGAPHGDFRRDFRGGFRGGFHRGFRGGVFFGGPVYDPFWYGPSWDFYYPYYGTPYYSPYPYYYGPFTDYGPLPAMPPAQGAYYCSDPEGYYPSVPNCYAQWQYVPPPP